MVTGPDFVAALLDARPESEIEVPTTAATTSTTEAQTSTTSSDGSPSPTTLAPSTTSTTQVLGFVPDAAPAGVDCG